MTATAAVTLNATPHPSISLTKTTTDDLVAGDPIVYTIMATNNGDVTLTDVQISESLTGATVVGTCPAATLAPAATTSCQYTYTAKQADVDAGCLDELVRRWWARIRFGTDVTATAAVTLNATPHPSISLTKTTTG